MIAPVRIQRKHTKGWRMPPHTLYVGRGTIWGNPFIVGSQSGIFDGKDGRGLGLRDQPEILVAELTLEKCIEFYREMIKGHIGPEMYPFAHDWRIAFGRRVIGCHPTEWARLVLRGKNLACFCALDQPCHADVLLEIANRVP